MEMQTDDYTDEDLAAAAKAADEAAAAATAGAGVEKVKLHAYALGLSKHKKTRLVKKFGLIKAATLRG